MKVKKYVIYAKEDFAMVKIKKANLNVIIKSDIIVTELENLEELLIVISIYSKKITYKLKFIDSYRFMPSKLSDLVDNLSEINKKKMSGMHEKKILNQNVNLSDLKIIDYITDAKNIKNMY